MTCKVSHAKSVWNAKAVAKSVITSSLFKAAMFGKDANWGRILCAIGYAPADVDVNKVDVHLQSTVGDLYVCHNGMGVEFDEEFATKAEAMSREYAIKQLTRRKKEELIKKGHPGMQFGT